jgi:hypothetical protein
MPPNPVVSARVDPSTLAQIEEYAGDRPRADAVTDLLEAGLACRGAGAAKSRGESDA